VEKTLNVADGTWRKLWVNKLICEIDGAWVLPILIYTAMYLQLCRFYRHTFQLNHQPSYNNGKKTRNNSIPMEISL